MSFTGFITRHAAKVPDIEQFERFLFIGPHSDDIDIGAGATAAKLAAMGKKVGFLVCADGRFGDENAPEGMTQEELITVREKEQKASAARYGVNDVRFLRFCDGGLYDENELFRAMAKAVGEFGPEVIFATDPDVISECHVDHLRVGRAARQLAFIAPFKKIMAEYGAESAPVKAIAFYMTAKPNRYVKTKGFFRTQLAALEDCFPSQYPKGNEALASIELYLKLRAYEFGFRRMCGTAEGFRVLGTTQMHCLPEAGEK